MPPRSLSRGLCPVCRLDVGVYENGYTTFHKQRVSYLLPNGTEVTYVGDSRCDGSGMPINPLERK